MAVCFARILSVLAMLGGVAPGCAEVSPAPLSAAASANDLNNRTLDDPRLLTFVRASLAGKTEPQPAISWNLTTLTLAAVYYHPDLAVARGRLALARARVVTAGQRPNPILNFAAVFDTAAVSGAIPPAAIPLTIGPVVDFIVETAGKPEYRVGEARHLSEAARWDLATTGWRVRARVRGALLKLWAARQRIALTLRRRELQTELVGLLERRLEIGEASALEVSRERIAGTRIAVDLRGFEGAAAAAEVQLATAVGVPVRALSGVNLGVDAFAHEGTLPEGDGAGELRRRALIGRSDVEAALAEYEAAQSALQLAVAGQYPDVRLGPGYNYDAGINKFSLSPTLELPVFNQNQGRIAEAIAKRQEAAADFTALQARIIGAIDSALAAYRAATRELATADALCSDAERREGEVGASFRAGQVDRPTLLSAQLETAATLLARFDASLVQREALGALEDALQHPLFEPSTAFSAPETSPLSALEPRS
ncbi:MAG: TolC family protein [Alphaproteobacteria bacterium]